MALRILPRPSKGDPANASPGPLMVARAGNVAAITDAVKIAQKKRRGPEKAWQDGGGGRHAFAQVGSLLLRRPSSGQSGRRILNSLHAAVGRDP